MLPRKTYVYPGVLKIVTPISGSLLGYSLVRAFSRRLADPSSMHEAAGLILVLIILAGFL